MEHIRQYDWCSLLPDQCFITEEEMDDSVTERILRNKFRDPMLSDDEGDERQKPVFDWDEIFKKTEQEERQFRLFVPGLRPIPPYPKISALTGQQHYQCLKVICSQNPTVLDRVFFPRPTKQDHKVFEELHQLYLKEQQEFKEWAKTLWMSTQCFRALRPKPTVETVYEAEFKVKANEVQSFPKTYKLAAQIPLEMTNTVCDMVFQKDLKKINATELPQSDFQLTIEKKTTIIRPASVPEPCNKHPSRFILPNEKSVSMLPLTEVHRELSQWALESGASFVSSESALKCLVETDRAWMLPVSVCEAISADGDRSNVVVLGSEFNIHREPAMVRTYKAFKHLLEHAVVPPEERMRIEMKRQNQEAKEKKGSAAKASTNTSNRRNRLDPEKMSASSDEDDFHLFIDDAANGPEKSQTLDTETTEAQLENLNLTFDNEPENDKTELDKSADDIGIYSCTCKDTEFEVPPPRSFKKWVVRNKTSKEEHTIIVHCSHKMRGQSGEIVVEPIPEYQLELAGSIQSPGKLASLALSLALRRNASLLNVRVDSSTGDIVTVENIFLEEFNSMHGETASLAANRIHSTLNQLEGLMPGHYVLQHETTHGANAMLYTPSSPESSQLTLEFDSTQLADTDEAKSVKTPPILAPVLLPYHKYRKILPLAFTPHENQLAKEPKKPPPSRKKIPPQAIKWPKKRPKRKNYLCSEDMS